MKTREKRVYITLSIVALLLFSLMSYIKGGAFDFDETFSLAMIDHSFSEMWKVTARDYHPPLSYFILKVLSWFIKPFSEGNLEIYRATSILGYFCTILLCIFPIRRLWGFRISVIAILLLVLMPVSFYIYSNFRMYAWAVPFVLASFVYACDAFQNNNKWSWVKLTLFSSAAMYTHYYSLISTFVMYALLFLVIILTSKAGKKKLIINYLISGVVLILLYAPWLYFFIGQLAEVKSDYWIENPAMSDIVFAIQYYFVPKYYTEKYINLLSNTWMIGVVPLLLITTIAIVSLSYSNLRNKVKHYHLQISVSIAAFTVLFVSLGLVMVYTFAVSPVYHIRYLMCYFGLFVLGLSICISILIEKNKLLGKLLVVGLILFVLFDFGLCVYMNIVRSNFSFAKLSEHSESQVNTIESYYCDEESFSDMAYLTILHPYNKYYLVTDDNPETRLASPPYIEGDTISGMPFSNFNKVKALEVDRPFFYLSKKNPQLDSTFSTKYQVMDSLYSGLYRVEPIN